MKFEQIQEIIQENLVKQEEKIMLEANVKEVLEQTEDVVMEVGNKEVVAAEQEKVDCAEPNVETEMVQQESLEAVSEGAVEESAPEPEITEDVQAAEAVLEPEAEEVGIETTNVTNMGVHSNVLTNSNLPSINSTDKKAMLCVRGNYALMMMPLYNAESLIVENCRFYLVNIITNEPMIGAGCELKLAKNKLLDASDHGVMSNINKFIVTFTEDDMKLAFERAKIYLENMKDMVAVSSSMTIQEAYCEVVLFAIEKAAQEKGAQTMDINRKCKYDEEEQIVYIRDNYLKDLLDEIGAGFTQTIFCKKLCLLEAHYGVQMMIKNKGRYACNSAGNIRFYKFRIVEELFEEGGAA